ncbi:MAG TPA: M2 family metallopeptidase [Polyangiaceae bacterium]|nr:M2 family metallopeptidase [Polyangiaceae bacterium]
MRNRTFIPLLFCVACGSTHPEPVSAPPAGEGEAASAEAAAAAPAVSDDAALINEAKAFVKEMDADLRTLYVNASVAAWANETDITPEHEAAAAKAGAEQAKGITRWIKASRKFDKVRDKLDETTRRQLVLLQFSGQPAPDDAKKADELAQLGTEMSSIYGKGKVCATVNGKEDCKDIEGLSKVLQTTRKPSEALAAWQGWHENVGRAERDRFIQYVELANDGARGVGFENVATMWKSGYDMPPDAFEAETDRLYDQMKPFYEQLHCYARRKLNKRYGDAVVPKTGPIPAHLLGNMWAQSWGWLYKELEPFPGEPPVDVTPTLAKAGAYDERKMVQIAEGFYTSLGFPALPATFWERSMFSKPPGKEVVCHASAWDVTFSNDLRIKMCIQKTQEDLDVIHHELGHDFYFAAYHQLPTLFQNGANDGFHEAIVDTVVLSMTPGYLKEKGLLKKAVKNDKVRLNQQMQRALEKVAFLPFGLVVDKWRWDVFSGKVGPDQYNEHWWKLRESYQGIKPAVARAATDFDPGAKYHVPANVPYMRYFLAAVLQFQFHRALCKAAGNTGPLDECSVYANKAAGDAFWKMLSLGASKPWQDALFELTGQREMDATAILDYFAPLQEWLKKQNQGQTCGW